jgi:hypothetical protein
MLLISSGNKVKGSQSHTDQQTRRPSEHDPRFALEEGERQQQ